MSNEKNPSFIDFCNWYKANRDRFKVSWRKRWDEVAAWENVPGDFRFEVINATDYSKMTVEYHQRRGWHSISVTVGRNRHFYFHGAEVMLELAKLEESGAIASMEHPSLGDALMVLTEFREELDQLDLRYTLNQQGHLTYINATNGEGLIRVMHSLEVEE